MPDRYQDKYLLEDASGGYQLEDGSGIYILEVPFLKINNYLHVKVGDGMSCTEKIR